MRAQQMLAVLAVVGSLTYASGTDKCPILSAADMQGVTGEQVHNIAQQSTAGAGGRCANYATSNGKMYLGVSQLTSAADYKTAVAAVPESVYPNRDQLTGVGDEAILMKDTTGKIRYLVARKGSRGVILFPSYRSGISDEQLKKLAVLALSR
jgi:tetrahydromethanopterin S-methyltransferase subunit D